MHRPVVLSLLACVVAAMTGVATSGAQAERQMVIPACEELLMPFEQKLAMNEKESSVLHRAVRGHTRICVYLGGSPGGGEHSVEVEVGPYTDFRQHVAYLDRTVVCPVSKAACGKVMTAAKLVPAAKSFSALASALKQVGTTRWVDSVMYDHNPAFVWLPTISPLDRLAMVAVYVPKTDQVIQVACTETDAREPDLHCALKAAEFVHTAIV
jgi:hypothetical protein